MKNCVIIISIPRIKSNFQDYFYNESNEKSLPECWEAKTSIRRQVVIQQYSFIEDKFFKNVLYLV